MRVVLWCTAAVLFLSVVATPVQANFPVCRDVTEGVPSEYTEGRYVRLNGGNIENWREWNGYTGLQTQKCVTEYGVILGSDTFVDSTSATNPGEQVPDDPTPEFPGIPTVPQTPLPGLCGSGDDPSTSDIIRHCLDRPDDPPPTFPGLPGGSDPNCEFRAHQIPEYINCNTRDSTPTAAYINWLQYVVGWILGE